MNIQLAKTLVFVPTLPDIEEANEKEEEDTVTEDRPSKATVEGDHKTDIERQDTVVEHHEETEAQEVNTEQESMWLKCKKAFNWDDFFYSLILGLIPTAWDVISDCLFGAALEQSGNIITAGFCYFLICLPGLFFFFEFLLHNMKQTFSITQNIFVFLILV